MKRFIKYLKAVKQELFKVNWPTKNETVRLTIVVIVLTAVFAVFIGLLDILLTYLVRTIIS